MLGMYDMPATQGANNRFWAAIRAHLGHGPDHLTRGMDFWDIWQSPDLLMAQTCGMPFRTRLHRQVTLIGTPDYGLPGCAAGYYHSVLVVRKDAPGETLGDFDGAVLAYNETVSQSGWGGPMIHFHKAGLSFRAKMRTGGHAASVQAVAEGHADIAGLDPLTWALLREHTGAADELRVIATTTPTPGLPYITAKTRDPAPIAAAIRAAIDAIGPQDRATLHLQGLTDIPKAAYLAVPNPSEPA